MNFTSRKKKVIKKIHYLCTLPLCFYHPLESEKKNTCTRMHTQSFFLCRATPFASTLVSYLYVYPVLLCPHPSFPNFFFNYFLSTYKHAQVFLILKIRKKQYLSFFSLKSFFHCFPSLHYQTIKGQVYTLSF